MATVTLSNLATTTYSGAVIHDYIMTDVFSNDKMRYFGPQDTDTINQPIVLHGDAIYRDDDLDHNEGQSELTAADITLFDPLKAYNRVKRRTVDERPGLQHLRNLGMSHGKALAKGKTLSLMISLAKSANTHGDEIDLIDFDTTGPTNATDLKNALKLLASNFDSAEVDNDGRFGLLKPSAFYELADQDGVMSVDFGGQANRQTVGGNMDAIRYLNTTWFNVGIGWGIDWGTSASVGGNPSYPGQLLDHDMTTTVGIAWQKDAWALREQALPTSSIDWIARLQVWQTLTRMEFGYKAITNNDSLPDGPGNGGIWAITDTSSNPI